MPAAAEASLRQYLQKGVRANPQTARYRHTPPVPGTPNEPELLGKWMATSRAAVLIQSMLAELYIKRTGPRSLVVVDRQQGRSIDDVKVTPILSMSIAPTTYFVDNLDFVFQAVTEREHRYEEVISQLQIPLQIAYDIAGITPARFPATHEWITNALNVVVAVEQRIKSIFACPRPMEYSPAIDPMITTPGHGSYPAGHANEMFALARFIERLFWLRFKDIEALSVQMVRLADRVAENRIVAGVHFPIDNASGAALGHTLADYLIWRSGLVPLGADGKPSRETQATFRTLKFEPDWQSMNGADPVDVPAQREDKTTLLERKPLRTLWAHNDLWARLGQSVRREWSEQ